MKDFIIKNKGSIAEQAAIIVLVLAIAVGALMFIGDKILDVFKAISDSLVID